MWRCHTNKGAEMHPQDLGTSPKLPMNHLNVATKLKSLTFIGHTITKIIF